MSVTGCKPGEEARISRTVRNSSAAIPAAKRKVIGASSRTRAVPLVSDPFVVSLGTTAALSRRQHFHFLRRRADGVVALVDRAPDRDDGAGFERVGNGDVGLVPKHNLERAGQVLEEDYGKGFALFLGELPVHLRDRPRDGESGAVGQFA